MEPKKPDAVAPALHERDSLERSLRAAFGAGTASTSSVLRILQSKARIRLGVQLPDAKGEHAEILKVTAEARSLRDTAGRYQVMGEIGRGGVGVVFKGHDVDLGRDVALKVLREEFAQHPDVLARFVEEAQIGGQLQHPGIVPVYEIGLQNGERPFFAMKLVKGETLAEQLGKRKDPSVDRRRFLGIFEQVCQTIAFAHARRVVHRDLKPGNIMIGAFGEVQVVDWGFAKVLPKPGEYGELPVKRAPEASQVSVISTVRSQPSASSHSVVGSTMGTPAYMPPEQALGDVAHMDERSDVFGLGAILCEILTGRAVYLFEDGDLIEQAGCCDMTKAHARIEHCGADASLIALCKQCLSPSRLARPASASEVAAQVGAYLTSVEDRAREAQIHAAEAKIKARSTMMLSAAAILIVVLGGGGYAWVEHAASARREHASQRVAEAMNEASGLVGQARAAGLQDLALWDRALSASEQAERLAKSEYVSDEQRTRSAALLASARGESKEAQDAAALASRDAGMVERLIEARIPPDDAERTAGWAAKEARRLDAVYADLFRKYLGGQDLMKLDPDAAARALEEGHIEVELAAGLDHWAIKRGKLKGEADAPSEAATRALQDLAQRIDHDDDWRSDLRARLREPEGDRNALEILARSADFQALPATSVLLLGAALWNVGATDAALEVYRQGRNMFPADVGLNLGLAQACELLGEPGREDAITGYRTVVALRPKMALARFCLGCVLRLQGHLDEASASYGRALQLDPKNAQAHNNLGGVLHAQDRLDEAIASFRQAIELDPRSVLAHTNLGVALHEQGRPDEAIASCRAAIEIDPKYAPAHDILGGVLNAQGHLDEAIASYRRAIELDPKRASVYANLATVLALQGSLDEAVATFHRAIELDPNYVRAHGGLGIALKSQGHIDEAIASFRHALELDPGDAWAHRTLGLTLEELGRLDEATASFKEAIELDPKNADLRLDLGNVLQSQDLLDEAIASFQKAIDLDSKSAMAHFNLGNALQAQGSLDESISSYRRAIELRPEYAAAQGNLGISLARQGRMGEAIASFRQAIELDPQRAEIHSNLGRALQEQGRLDEALSEYRVAYDIFSTGKDAFSVESASMTKSQVEALERITTDGEKK